MVREKLPETRQGITHRAVIYDIDAAQDYDVYIRLGTYQDGRIGEVFAGVGKQGGTIQGMLDGWCIAISIALQNGADLTALTEKFTGQRFSPCGETNNPSIPQCTSLYDYIMRFMFMTQEVVDASVSD